MFTKLFSGKRPTLGAVIFDPPGPTVRDAKYAESKAQRPPMPKELAQQLPLIDSLVRAYNYPMLRVPGLEADDVIATLAEAAVLVGHEVVIVSSDKDFAQLVRDSDASDRASRGSCKMHDSLRDVLFDAELVRKKWGVAPSQMVDLQALVGDAADNVPGVAGIGQKGAGQLLEEHGTLEEIFAKLASDPGSFKPRTRTSLEAGIDAARLSRELVLLDRHAALPVALADLTIPEPDPRVVNDALKALEFYSLLSHQETAAAKAEQRAEGRSEFLQFAEIDALKDHLAATPTGQPTALLGVWEGRARAGHLVGLGVCVAVPEDGATAATPLWVPARQIEALRGWLEDADAPKIVHDGRQLALALRDFSQGITLRGVEFDTQLASFLVDPNLLINEHHELHAVVKEYLHRTLPALKDLTGGGKAQKSLETLEESSLAQLVAEHAQAVRALEPILRPLLVERAQGEVYRDVELPLGPILAQMEYDGIGVDLQELARIGDELVAQRSALTTVIHGLAGRSFNIGSPKQLGDVLFEELKLPIVKRTKSGYSTDAEVLEKLAPKPLSRLGNADPKTHPIATEILRYRLVDKLINTYTDVLQRSVDPRTGRVHCTFQQTVGVTGRLITTDPDLQRTPVKTDEGKRIRDAFVAQPLADGTATCIVDADWSQIELRLLAHLSGDPLLVDAFVNHADVHGATALGQLLGVSRKEASDYIAGYFAAYAGVKTWVAAMVERADRLGYAETLLGRRRIIPDLASQSPMTRSFGERVAANTPVQGSAADLCKLAMLHIAAKLPAVSPRGRMVLQVHDELLFEVPESDAVAVAAMVKHEMEHVLELRVPLVAEVRIGKSWGAAKAATAV
ncbi:hypothetical protein OUZ56_032570 [Daphnia magna]|uniref:DNA-directed DNA polymerase n=1 Tax=Daphnia magna TaxID=35525 RepID=A0ABR0B996_9CRUS|nr:hypothetical protein OUZ56_032570 [Daphnia magna]